MTTILRPSNAHRWANCSGSYHLQQSFPDDEESPEAREGTAAHFYVTEALQDRVWPVGHLAPNGHPIDADMVEHGQAFLDYVWGHLAKSSPTAALLVERPLTAHGLIHPLCEGTPDVGIVDATAHRIVVPDYKYGHREVDPFRNEQGLAYIATMLEAYELTREDVKGWEVIFAIVQPRTFRAEPVREWRMLGWQAWDMIALLSAKADAAVAPGSPARTGPWCRDCSALHGCSAALAQGDLILDLVDVSTPYELSDRALGLQLRRLTAAKKRLEAMTTALEEAALSKIRTGRQIPGWTIGHGDAREKWTVPTAEVLALGDMLGVTLGKPAEPITPNQARDALKRGGVDASVISAYAERPRGAAKLVPVDEKAAAKAFS